MDDLDGDDDGLQFVHTNLPSSTAEALGVPSLMGRMLDAEELDFRYVTLVRGSLAPVPV